MHILRTQLCLTLALCFTLFAPGCGDEDVNGDDGDTSSEVCCDCYEVDDPCPPEAEALTCEDTMPWCGGQTASGNATWRCYQGVWGEFPSGAGAPSPNPAKCVAVHGESGPASGWDRSLYTECFRAISLT